MPDDLEAIRRIGVILDEFTHSERERIIRWVCEREHIPVDVGQRLSNQVEERPPTAVPLDPQKALRDGIAHGNIDSVRSALERFREIGATDGQIVAASALAAGGDEIGARVLFNLLSSDDITSEAKKHAVAALYQYFVVRDREKEGVSVLVPLLSNLANITEQKSDRAYYLNQLGRVLYAAGDLTKALKAQQEAVSLAPDDTSYQHNLSIIFHRLGKLDMAADAALRAIQHDDADADHLKHAVELFMESGDVKALFMAYERLRELDPRAAQEIVASNPKLRKRLRHE